MDTSLKTTEKQFIENAAKAIYKLFPGADEHPWVDGGNSHKQDEARCYALAAISAQGQCKANKPDLYNELEVDVKLQTSLSQVGGPLSEEIPFSYVRTFCHHFAKALMTPTHKG